jgi:hypothetical protein
MYGIRFSLSFLEVRDLDAAEPTEVSELSDFRSGRREVPRRAGGLKALTPMGSVAEGFVFGKAATAQPDDGTAAKPEGVAVGIGDNVVAFDADGSVGVDGNFRWHVYT